MADLAAWRLQSQRLSGQPCASPAEVVGWLTAVQAQDYGGAVWAVGQRTAGATRAEIDQLVDAGVILRTHVLRPTWHFVLADDIRWVVGLSGPRVLAAIASRLRRLEIDGDVGARAHAVFEAELSGGRSLTRPELEEALRKNGIPTEGQQLPHLLMAAELQGLIVSGPRRGTAHTYALLEDRAPDARSLSRDEALAELTRRYFQSHGPAQIQDAVWWSGLTASDIRKGITLVGDTLAHGVFEGKDYWFDAEAGPVPGETDVAHLLPNWDEYTVSYRDRSATLHPEIPFDPTLFSFGSVLSNVVTIAGRVRGAWGRTVAGQRVRIDARLLAPLAPQEAEAVEIVAGRMESFLGQTVELSGIR